MTEPRTTPFSPGVLEQLVRHASLAADSVALMPHVSGAQCTRSMLRESLRMLLDNGLIEAVPVERWPQHVVTPSLNDLRRNVAGSAGGL